MHAYRVTQPIDKLVCHYASAMLYNWTVLALFNVFLLFLDDHSKHKTNGLIVRNYSAIAHAHGRTVLLLLQRQVITIMHFDTT